MTDRDLLADVRTALGASGSASGEVSILYLAVARNALARAREEMKQLAALITAREAELARLGVPKTQLTLEDPKP